MPGEPGKVPELDAQGLRLYEGQCACVGCVRTQHTYNSHRIRVPVRTHLTIPFEASSKLVKRVAQLPRLLETLWLTGRERSYVASLNVTAQQLSTSACLPRRERELARGGRIA